MSVAAVASPSTSPVSSSIRPSDQQIQQAKADFMAFIKTPDFEPLAGNLIDFKDALVKINSEWKNNPKLAFAHGTGLIFSELFQNADDTGHLKSAAQVFFAEDIDQVPFVADLVKQVIASVGEQEAADGELIDASNESVAQAREELMTFIKSDDFLAASGSSLADFKKKLLEVKRLAKGDHMTAFVVDHKDCPGYSHLFRELIKKAEEDTFLSEKVSAIVFAPKFDEIKFIESIVNEIIEMQ